MNYDLMTKSICAHNKMIPDETPNSIAFSVGGDIQRARASVYKQGRWIGAMNDIMINSISTWKSMTINSGSTPQMCNYSRLPFVRCQIVTTSVEIEERMYENVYPIFIMTSNRAAVVFADESRTVQLSIAT